MAASSSGRVFAHLKERSRSSFVGQHRLDVIVHSRLERGPKYISLSTLKSTFGVAGLVLTQEEVDYLIKRFADNRRHIEWRRLMVALDVAAPGDFTDPDQSFLDNLPQPYRLIVSVLETEIVDRAWALIVERHPELDTSPTDEARAAADIDLKRSCSPSLRLQNPHPPLLLDGNVREAETTEAIDGSFPEQIKVEGGVEERLNGHGAEEDRESGDDEVTLARACGGRGGGMMLLRWDRCGELLFTAGRDDSICLRASGALQDIAVQISSRCGRSTPLNEKEAAAEARAMGKITFLSEPVGALTDQRGRPSSVRIAAVATSTEYKDTSSEEADGATKVDGGGEGATTDTGDTPARTTTVVSVLEVAVPETRSSAGAGFGHAAGSGHISDGHGDGSSERPTLEVVCQVELSSPEVAVACALSPDGRRLAVCLADGRIFTWVLPAFSPLSKASQQNKSGAGARTATQHGDDGDGGASLGDSSTSLIGKDDAEAMTKEAAAAAATEPPLRLERPEFGIPHLPSPEELAYAKALQEYRRRVEAGEIQEPTSASGGGGDEVENGCTPPPPAPQLSGCAHHLARVEFLPIAPGADGGGGLSVWRLNSNVWRFYRLPPPPSEVDGKPEDTEGAVTDADAGCEDADQTGRENGPVMPPKFDVSSLPSAEWILPSPITTLAVSEGDEGGGRGGAAGEDDRRMLQAGGGPGGDWTCCRGAASAVEPAPLVAIGTENGGVFLCDAALGTTREALSRHRDRVTTLAFHRKRFLVSGSADEMLQIHHITAAATGGGGAGYCNGGTPRLRCLHDARGGEMVRIACLREAPLAFAEDTLGRIVAYDLLSGSMLGVLALGDSSTASPEAARPGVVGSSGAAASAETIVQKPGVVWASGGGRLAAVIFDEKRESPALSQAPPAGSETLGVWSGSDVMWGLSPGLRAIAGEERPRDVAALFFGLVPAQRKNTEGKPGFGAQPLLPPPSPPAASRSRAHLSDNHHSRRGATPPPRTGTADTASRSHRGAAAAGGRSSGDIGLGCRGGGGNESPTAASKADLRADHHAPALTEGNVAQLLAGGPFGGIFAERGVGAGEGGVDVPWRSEVGAAGRVKRYMRERHGDRAARQARLENAARNLLHAL